MIRINFFFLILLCALACTRTQAPENQSKAQFTSRENTEVPKLLDRAVELRNGKEWDDIQNFYAAQVKALMANPQDQEARLKLAECFIQEARVTGEHPHYYPAALAMVNPVVQDLENKPQADIRQKDMLFRALSHKASIQLSLHDFVAAKKTAQEATALNPYNAYIVGCLVDAHVELGEYEDAVKMCDRMVSIRPDLRSYARVSYLREIHNDLKGAIEAMKMAVSAGYPGYEQTEWARLQLGKLYEKAGNPKEAEIQYQNILQVRENYPFAIAALAELEEKKGRYAQALEAFQKAADIIPEIGFYMDMARIYQKMGNISAAQALLPKIENMFAEDMAAGHNMGLEAARFQLEFKKDKTKAMEMLKPELEARPNNRDVKALAAEIEGVKTK